MNRLQIFIVFIGLLFFSSCGNSTKQSENKSENYSQWRDKNEVDSASFYSSSESCEKIIGKLNIRSRLHKNLMEEGVFGGGISSRWLEIAQDSITYFSPSGEIADKGSCKCQNGVLRVDWIVRYDRQMEYTIHFNSSDFVELRYYDYPFSFDTFEYDKNKEPTNPTKIIGTIIR